MQVQCVITDPIVQIQVEELAHGTAELTEVLVLSQIQEVLLGNDRTFLLQMVSKQDQTETIDQIQMAGVNGIAGNKLTKILLSIVLSFISIPAIAEEIQEPVEVPTVTLIHEPEDQKPENHNIYSVVDENGVIQNNVVCADSVCGDSGQWSGSMPQDTPWAGMKLVKQRSGNVGGYWGTYDSSNQTFTIDRSCSTCEIFSDVQKPGTIKDGVVTDPIIIPGLDTYMLNNPQLTIDEAAELLKGLLRSQTYSLNAMKSSFIVKGKGIIVEKKSKFKTIKLTPNLKDFKKISRTQKVCKIKNNTVLILKSGNCKIDIYKDAQKESVTTKVKK